MTNSPRRVYLDANVFIAYLANEAGRAQIVASLLEDAESSRIGLLTSVLSVTEAAFVSSDNASDDSGADENAIAQLWIPESPIKLVDLSIRTAERARRIVRESRKSNMRRIKPPDAIHIATTETHDCDAFFTYETETTRRQWQHLVGGTVSEPFTDRPQLDLN